MCSSDLNQFNLYPNPNNGNMQLDYTLGHREKGELIIYDIRGKELRNYQLTEGKGVLVIGETAFKNGIYLYKIRVNDKVVITDKLVIIR